jgi:hypothetical protein
LGRWYAGSCSKVEEDWAEGRKEIESHDRLHDVYDLVLSFMSDEGV